ncbi:MAG TPA: hypothetical protein VKE96_14350 [Vicinamibacterales bacterium]|nr:hypothetical protein [Vicinamibacterales bacterium]
MTKRSLAVGALITLLAASPACAQTYGYGGYGRYPDPRYGREIQRQAFDRGYREGLEQGRKDARHNRDYAPMRHSEYRDGDDGYHRGDGDREFYRRHYRQGFDVGYREAFDRSVRYYRR